MPRGLPRVYLEKAWKPGISRSAWFKKAWKLYKQSKVYQAEKKAKSLYRRKPKRRLGGKKMARRRRSKRRRHRSFTISVASVLGLAKGLLFPFGKSNLERLQSGDFIGAFDATMAGYTGFNVEGKFDVNWLKEGLLPLVIGMAVHKIASKLGINRMLARAGIPFIRI